MRAALSARPAAAGIAGGLAAEFAQLGRPAGGSRAASGSQRRWPGTEFAELESVECARSAGAAGAGADVGGSLDSALCALAGTAAERAPGTRHRQERGQRAVRGRYRTQARRADAAKVWRASVDRRDDR